MPTQEEQQCDKKLNSFRPRIHQFRLKSNKCQNQTKSEETHEKKNHPETVSKPKEKIETRPEPHQEIPTTIAEEEELKTNSNTELYENKPIKEINTYNVCSCEPIESTDRSTQTAFDNENNNDTKNAGNQYRRSSLGTENTNDNRKMNTLYLCTKMFQNSSNSKDSKDDEDQQKICPTCGACQDQSQNSVTDREINNTLNSNKSQSNKDYDNDNYYNGTSNSDYNTVETTDSEYDIRNRRREQQFSDRNNSNFNNVPISQPDRNTCNCCCCCHKNNNNATPSRQKNNNYFKEQNEQYKKQHDIEIERHLNKYRSPNQRLQPPSHCTCNNTDKTFFLSSNQEQNDINRNTYSFMEDPEIRLTNGSNRKKRLESTDQKKQSYKKNNLEHDNDRAFTKNREQTSQSKNRTYDDQKNHKIPICNKNIPYPKCKQLQNYHLSDNSEESCIESNTSMETLHNDENIHLRKCPCCELLAQNVNTSELEKLYEDDGSCSKNKNGHFSGNIKSVNNRNSTKDKYYQSQTPQSAHERRRFSEESKHSQPPNSYNQRIPDTEDNHYRCCDCNCNYGTQKRCNAGSNTSHQQYIRGLKNRYGIQKVYSKHKDIYEKNPYQDMLNERYYSPKQPQIKSHSTERNYRKQQSHNNYPKNASNYYGKKTPFFNTIINLLTENEIEDEQNEDLRYYNKSKYLNPGNFSHRNYKSVNRNERSDSDPGESDETEYVSSLESQHNRIFAENMENPHQKCKNEIKYNGRMCGGKQTPYYVEEYKSFERKSSSNANRIKSCQLDNIVEKNIKSNEITNINTRNHLDRGVSSTKKKIQIDNKTENGTQLNRITKNKNQHDGKIKNQKHIGKNAKNKIHLEENKRNQNYFDQNVRANIQLNDKSRIENRNDGNSANNKTPKSFKKSLNSCKQFFNIRKKTIPGQDNNIHHRKYQMKTSLCKDFLKYFETTDIATDCETTSCDFG